MATPLSNIILPLSELQHQGTLLSNTSKFPTQSSITSKSNKQNTSISICRVKVSEPIASISSTVTELDQNQRAKQESVLDEQQEEEKIATNEQRLADIWHEIHGEDDWVGLLDPMDPILRSELIRYGEMAQACYDAFDFDPFSKYCGSCRYTSRKFFDYLGMAHHGYDVARYLYATSNINLPNFFKKSRWPKVWSKNANWIGYVAVSNDETTQRLGLQRHNHRMAWNGDVSGMDCGFDGFSQTHFKE
ncbi:Phospholipase A1-Igamma1 chloroplastic [Quillaja saponaria]|uniref:Phospholipase A1-Igamma1 chloroplastic n=1 Tax=Quillaja saponaria TaxID=32244 RepID=A0AAD7Q9G8_QUISA|nr:Phospholipase A1-Igamma1 chloroplastic [Quillaja saponaria]